MQYHFVCIQAINPTGYVTGDGDNVAAKSGRLVTYNLGELRAARPCGMIVCELAESGVVKMDLTGVGSGVQAFIAGHHWPASYRVLLAEEPDTEGAPGSTITVLGDNSADVTIYWQGAKHFAALTWDGHALIHTLVRAKRAEAKVKELEAQLAAAGGSGGGTSPGATDAETQAAKQLAAAVKVLMG